MVKDTHRKIVEMSWEEFESQLGSSTRAGKSRTISDNAMREYFGDQQFERLKTLAGRVRKVRSTRATLRGNVVFLHGIMGGELTVTEEADEDVVWMSLRRLVMGRVKDLKLSPDGTHESDANLVVSASGLDKRTYAETILWLKARWNVEPFAYDWRKDITVSSNALKDFIHARFPSKPVHLVAHSMGGLVSRYFIRQHPLAWKAMLDPKKVQGGRLIMLGTPNYGSYAIPLAMTGGDKLVKVLAAADLRHNLDEVLNILNSFVGSYQLLPAPSKLPASEQMLYELASWGQYPVSGKHLQRAMKFHEELGTPTTIDGERMVYIAGCNQETLAGVRLASPGNFVFDVTLYGDGRVPHALGLLPSVPTYYVNEIHGDLQKNEQVLEAIDELLENGRTTVLALQPTAARTVRPVTSSRARAVRDREEARQVHAVAERVKNETASPDDYRKAETMIMRAVIGQAPLEEGVVVEGRKAPAPKATPSIPLVVELVHGDIRDVKAPVVVAGHYRGVEPVRAIGALDKALSYWISKGVKRGMVGAGLGEVFLIPTAHKTIAADAVMLAGMGEYGRFNRDDLDYLFANVTYALTALGLRTFATVVIGSGEGNLSLDQALEGLIKGVGEAVSHLSPKERLKTLMVVESNDKRFEEITRVFEKLSQSSDSSTLKLSLKARHLRKRRISRSTNKPRELDTMRGSRITVERHQDVFHFSAITKQAVIPVREIPVQSSKAEGAADLLKSATSLNEQKKYGKLLHAYLMPEDFQVMIDMSPLTLIVDRSSASFPWEMAAFDSNRGTIFYGPHRQLTRQFRTFLSGAPGLAPEVNRHLRVLVIADPAPESELQLPEARAEGREVVNILREINEKNGLDIEVEERIGPNECDPVELLALILSEEFDVIHYAGHGEFDKNTPSLSGWVFGRDNILSARDIFRARRVPRLIFANACFSGVVRSGKALTIQETNRNLAGLAEAFFERGVQNYIGTGWPVGDEPARQFARTFYERALSGSVLSEALAAARLQILDQGSTWGAYQHYGEAMATLVRLGKDVLSPDR